ncbi:hypothetical protein [Stutzerimonas chloritidismutans]|uniref:Uncharacterized protein n=1 Tax=Stutzerimonas chloritidismutans TaxID=203192 RepID=A0ABU9MDQ9_STUCH
MNALNKKPLALATALMAASLALPATAQETQKSMQTQQAGASIRVGHNVVDAVDDVRENVADLIGSLRYSGVSMGLGNWQQSEPQLAKMEQQLNQQMEHRLDEKAERTDDDWVTWIRDEDYKVSVTKQVNELASHLDEVAKMLGGANSQKMQEIDSADVANQVDDLQETVEDLVQALERMDGMSVNKANLQKAQQRLDVMEKELDRQTEMAEEEWRPYAIGDQFTPGVQKNITELAQILRSLFQQS